MSDHAKKTFEDIVLGETYEFDVRITEKLVGDFSELSGDKNPLHMDAGYAAETPYNKRIAHGMIASALFSRLVGMHLPGIYSVYISQSLKFHQPMYIDDEVLVCGKVEQKSEGVRSVKIFTSVLRAGSRELLVGGEALVKMLK